MPVTGFVQQFLSFSRHLVLFGLVLVAWPFLRERPSFATLPDRVVAVTLTPVGQRAPAGWTLHGAWRLSASDPRLVGLSGLACDAEEPLEMVTDTGARLFMPAPAKGAARVAASIQSLPGLVDGEAIVQLGDRRAYLDEVRHRLHVITKGKAFARLPLPGHDGPTSWAVEAAIEPGGDETPAIVFHEYERRAYAFTDFKRESFSVLAVEGAGMAITGGARHPDGRAFVLMRSIGPTGFRAAIAAVTLDENRVTIGAALDLGLPWHANAEGMCIEPRGAGSARLWVVTDDNGLSLMTQRLAAWDVPDDAWPATPEGTGTSSRSAPWRFRASA